jgi:hypothetical protein
LTSAAEGFVAAVPSGKRLGGALYLFNVDFGVADSLGVQLLLESVAVAAPGGGKHGDGAVFGGEVHVSSSGVGSCRSVSFQSTVTRVPVFPSLCCDGMLVPCVDVT